MPPTQSQPKAPHPHEGKLWHIFLVAVLCVAVFVLSLMLGYRFYKVQQLIRFSERQESAVEIGTFTGESRVLTDTI